MSLGISFESVIDAARCGAEWAWTAIYRDLSSNVLGYLRAIGSIEPEDVTGEVFLQVVRNFHLFEGDESAFRTWVFTIARRRYVDEQRAFYRRPCQAVSDESLQAGAAVGDSEAEALDILRREEVAAIIRRLSPDQCDVLLLRILAGLTLEETAAVVGKTLTAVKALQRRGLGALRKEISIQAVSI